MMPYNTSQNTNIALIRNIKGISTCYNCKSSYIVYDKSIDEIYCYTCGTVLRQALTDYELLIQKVSKSKK